MTDVVSVMSGTVAEVLVKEGDEVTAGQDVVILESMKMHIPIKATSPGKVTKILVGKGQFVKTSEPLVTLE